MFTKAKAMAESRTVKSSLSGFKLAFITLGIGSILAFMAAPVFLGLVILTASVVTTVVAYSVIAFVVGFVYNFFKQKPKAQIEAKDVKATEA
jgi:hypothetical protein